MAVVVALVEMVAAVVLVEMVAAVVLETEVQEALAAVVVSTSCLSIWNPAAIPATTRPFQGESCFSGFSL